VYDIDVTFLTSLSTLSCPLKIYSSRSESPNSSILRYLSGFTQATHTAPCPRDMRNPQSDLSRNRGPLDGHLYPTFDLDVD
jgi:hypothetical protein